MGQEKYVTGSTAISILTKGVLFLCFDAGLLLSVRYLSVLFFREHRKAQSSSTFTY